MATKQLLGSITKQLGFYQFTLLVSRVIGVVRDLLIILVIGSSALTDQIFFIFSFPDIFMSILVGGGAILFLSEHYDEKTGAENIPSIALSAALLYSLVAIFFIVFEYAFDFSIGRLLYVDISNNKDLNAAYIIAVLCLLFSLPMVVPNSIFLSKSKLFLQPLMNIVYTVVVIMLMLLTYYLEALSVALAAIVIVVGSVCRLLIAVIVSFRLCKGDVGEVYILRDKNFYKGLMLSGLSIGVLVLLPFIFRAKLPEFGDGFYASSSIYFKFNDLILAFFVVPLTTMLLKGGHKDGEVIRTLLMVLVLCMLAAVVIWLTVNVITRYNVDVAILSVSPDLAVYVAICLVFSSAAFMVSMLMVKKKLHKISTIAAGGALIYILYARFMAGGDLVKYFYDLYISYMIYIGIVSVMFALLCKRKYA